jgi:site-specific DNA-methyltransferase (adenine-specific)
MIDLRLGDCLEILKTLEDNSVDSIVTDPPYGIGFMNKEWDSPQKHKELIERENKRSQERFQEGKSPVKGGFSKGVQPGLPIGGAKEGRWFQEWCEEWAKECFRVLKPGGHLLSFSAPRTYHRMATAFEDSGFQIRDQIMWVFGSGFPKSHNIGKAIDKIQGNKREVVVDNPNKRTNKADLSIEPLNSLKKDFDLTKGNGEWEGWGTALKPAHEPICMARKPITEKSIAHNVLKYGTGAINIDDCRIETTDNLNGGIYNTKGTSKKDLDDATSYYMKVIETDFIQPEGRFPANIIFDKEAGKILDEQSDNASRFFYCPKVSKKERNAGLEDFEDKLQASASFRPNHMEKALNGEDGNPFGRYTPTKNIHPTVKPIALMEYLIKLVTPKGGIVLEPFMGSGSTGIAAKNLGMSFIGIEKEEEYFEIAKQRIKGN